MADRTVEPVDAPSRPVVHAPEFLVPAHCRSEWLALSAALRGRRAPCQASPDAWWEGGGLEAAAAACGACPARSECLAYAVAAGERFGVWGGLLPAQRRVLRSGVAS